MKFNIEVELEWINEEYTLDDAFKEEIARQAGIVAAQTLAKQDFLALNREENVKALELEYKETLTKLRQEEYKKREEVMSKIEDVFADFIAGKAFKVNSWGQPEREYTVGEYIQERVATELKDINKIIDNLVSKHVNEKIKLSEYNIKNLVEATAKTVQNENAKAVAEFIVKGIR